MRARSLSPRWVHPCGSGAGCIDGADSDWPCTGCICPGCAVIVVGGVCEGSAVLCDGGAEGACVPGACAGGCDEAGPGCAAVCGGCAVCADCAVCGACAMASAENSVNATAALTCVGMPFIFPSTLPSSRRSL